MEIFGTYLTNLVKTTICTAFPNKVDEYTYDQYLAEYKMHEVVYTLYSSFFLYKVANHYDIIYLPCINSDESNLVDRRAYSIFRFQGELNVCLVFLKHYADIISVIADIHYENHLKVDRNLLEKITQFCRRYSKRSCAHLVASLQFQSALTDKRIISHINDVDHDDDTTPLFVAVSTNNVNLVKAFLHISSLELMHVNAQGYTALHIAACKPSELMLRALLQSDGSEDELSIGGPSANFRFAINQINYAGETPLHMFVKERAIGCVEVLLVAGADATVGEADKYPLHLATEMEMDECIDLLLRHCPDGMNVQTRTQGLSVLHLAPSKQMFLRYVELGVDLSLQDVDGNTALHLKVLEQDLDSVLALLIRSADPNIATADGNTALHFAVQGGLDISIIYALIAFEADPNAENANGFTPRHCLCMHKSKKYQKMASRDVALYALHAVGARRCAVGLPNCTAGCISADAGRRASDNPPQPPSDASQFTSLYQMLNDLRKRYTSDESLVTEELFDGCPPVPVLDKAQLTSDIDNDLFSCIVSGQPTVDVRLGKSISTGVVSSLRDIPCLSSRFVEERRGLPPSNSLLNSLEHPCRPVLCRSMSSLEKVGFTYSNTPLCRRGNSQLPQGLNTTATNDLTHCHDLVDTEHGWASGDEGVSHEDVVSETHENSDSAENVEGESNGLCTASRSPLTYEFFNPNNKNFSFVWSRQFPECSAKADVPCCQQRFSRCLTATPRRYRRSKAKISVISNNEEAIDSPFDREMLDDDGFRYGRRGYRILSLDGGGIRGLIITQTLRAIERSAGKPIRELFDWITGTSTGGMLALNLTQGKCVRYCRSLYFRMKDKIFCGNRPYPTEPLEQLFVQEFGPETTMSDLTHIRVSVTALRSDVFPPNLLLFRNYNGPHDCMERLVTGMAAVKTDKPMPVVPNQPTRGGVTIPARVSNPAPSSRPDTALSRVEPFSSDVNDYITELLGERLGEMCDSDSSAQLSESMLSFLSTFSRQFVDHAYEKPTSNEEQLVWLAARASGAAPTYYRACGQFLDGGLISNNPTLDVLTEFQEISLVRRLSHTPIVPIAVVTSLGTGRSPTRELQDIDIFRPKGPMEAYRSLVCMTELCRILIAMATMSEGRVVERARSWCSSIQVPFFRFSPFLSSDIPLDTIHNKVLLQMLWETEAYIYRARDRIRRLVKHLSNK